MTFLSQHLERLNADRTNADLSSLFDDGSDKKLKSNVIVRLPVREAVLIDLLSFFADRLKVHLRAEGIRHDVIDAALPENWDGDIVLLVNRVRALQAFLDTEDGANLLILFKRSVNMFLKTAEDTDGVEYSLDPNPDLAENDSEKALFAALAATDPQIDTALAAEDFAAAMAAIAALRGPLDAYFEATLINSDNQIIRRNRLCLLNRIRTLFARIADFGRIEG